MRLRQYVRATQCVRATSFFLVCVLQSVKRSKPVYFYFKYSFRFTNYQFLFWYSIGRASRLFDDIRVELYYSVGTENYGFLSCGMEFFSVCALAQWRYIFCCARRWECILFTSCVHSFAQFSCNFMSYRLVLEDPSGYSDRPFGDISYGA